MTMWTSDRRLWLDASGGVVEDGDPAAATLLVGADGQIDVAEAERLGLRKRDLAGEPSPSAPVEDAAAEKARPKSANKARSAPATKER